jgi:archaeal chaperonin
MSDKVQPIYILPEGANRTTGKTAQRNNIMAAKLVAETVRTTLGPRGMDKMLVDSGGNVVITNDGVTILEEMNIEHPGAKMVVEVAKTQEQEVGDGTTTAVVLAGELLKNAESLLDQNIHPTVIAKGYQLAAERAQQVLIRIGEPIDSNQEDILRKIAMTAMTGKCADVAKERLAHLVVSASKLIEDNGLIDKDNIKIEKQTGESIENTSLIRGLVLDKDRVHKGMPEKVENAKVLLLNIGLEQKETDTDAKIQITQPQQMQAFLDQEERMLQNMVEKVLGTGANVIFTQKGIDDYVQHLLSKKGIYACRRVKQSDMRRLSKALNTPIFASLDGINFQELGNAGQVYEEKVGDEELTYVTDCANPKAVTLLVRGGTEHVIDEIKRALEDAIGDISSALKDKKVVAGAGAPEIELARELRKFAETLSGREQLAVNAFADSLEIIPKTLAENAGLDPIDILTELKSLHESGKKWAGVNVFTGKSMDAFAEGVIEPLKIKTQAVKSATEVAVMILRIDDVIASGKVNSINNQEM